MVRFTITDDKVSAALDQPCENDTRFRYEGKTVLVLSEEVAKALTAKTLDVSQTDKVTELILLDSP